MIVILQWIALILGIILITVTFVIGIPIAIIGGFKLGWRFSQWLVDKLQLGA